MVGTHGGAGRESLVDVLRTRGRPHRLGLGEILCRQNDPAGAVFIVEEGTIDAVIDGPAGEITLASHGVGTVLGEVSCVIGGRRTATLRASEDARVTIIDASAFRTVLEAQPDAATVILEQARDRAERTRVATHLAAAINSRDHAVISHIAELVSWRALRAGEVLFHAADPSDGAYLLTAGRLRVDLPEQGRTVDIGRGEVLGESGLLAGQQRSATVSALRDCTLAQLSAEDFRTLMSENPDVAVGLVAQVLARSSGATPRSERPARLVAMIHLDDDPDPQISASFLRAMQNVGSTSHLSPHVTESMLGSSLAEGGEPGTAGDVRLTELFHRAESDHDQILLESGDVGSAWTRRVLRQADQIVFVGSAGLFGKAGDRLLEVLQLRSTNVPAWLMQVHPRSTQRPSGTPRLLERFGVDEVHHVRAGSTTDIARVARLAVGRGVGLVLSGGGARGFAHLGVVRALEECDVPIDRIVGASMGAVIAGGVAQHLPPAQRVPVLTRQVEGLLDYTVPIVSLIKAERISEALREQFGDWDVSDLWTPMACVSTNLTTSKVMVHRQGPLDRALRASTSIPGVLPPVARDGDYLVDGGILKNLPVDVMEHDASVSTIIASDVTPSEGPRATVDPGLSVSGWEVLASKLRRNHAASHHQSLGSVLMRSMLLGSRRDRDAAVASGVIDLYLDLDLGDVGLLDFEVVAPVAATGYDSSLERVREWANQRASSIDLR